MGALQADPNIRNKEGQTPLQIATRMNFIEGVEELVKRGAQVDVAASSESPVLILGTAGSGRQHVARRIHRQGTRAERAFVVVPCGALDGPAVTLALYGDDQQRGRIELARGGTLLLEDVDRLPVEAQRRLAAALNEESRRPDGTRPLATSRPATESIEPELLQRLAVLRLELPRLVDRREDIGLLAERMLREISREYGREHPRFAKDALAALTAYGWPGETQELRNVVERIFLSTKGEVVTAADLPADLSGVRDVTEDLYRSFGSLDEGLAAFAAYYVRRVFSEVGDDETLAAERLGLTVDELRRKLDELAIRQG